VQGTHQNYVYGIGVQLPLGLQVGEPPGPHTSTLPPPPGQLNETKAYVSPAAFACLNAWKRPCESDDKEKKSAPKNKPIVAITKEIFFMMINV
jgi:hypothetical protein